MAPRWRYLLAEVGVGLWRNPLMTLATVVTVTVSLALLGIGLLLSIQVDLANQVFYQEVEVSIFLENDISEEQRVAFEEELKSNPEVESVLYESKEKAFENAKIIFADDDVLLSTLEPDDLPASFRVSLFDPTKFEVVRSQYVEYPGVSEVYDQRETLDRLFLITGVVQWSALGIALIQLLAAAALIANTIRITAFARRDQTGIMKLVGATNWYIRMPFILEGIATAITGALLAGGVLMIGVVFAAPRIKQAIPFLPAIAFPHVFTVLPLLVLVGAVVAAVAAFLSMRRFLDV